MSKDFIITVTVVLSNTVTNADSREGAIEWVKETIYQDYGLDITDEEITSVEEL